MKVEIGLKDIFKIAFPIMLGNVSMSIAGIADTIFMEKIGHAEMDAVGYCSLLLFIITILGWATARGVQILTAQFDGSTQYKKVGEIFDLTMVILFFVGILCFIIFKFYAAAILGLLIQNQEVLKHAIVFTEIRSWAFLFINIAFVVTAFYTGIGKTKIMIFAVAVTAILNIVLNFVFVFGKFGFPSMKVAGSAWATNISDLLSVVIYLISLYISKTDFQKYQLFKFVNFSKKLLNEIITISAPLVLQHLFSLGAWVLFFTWIESLGTKQLAVSMIVKSIYMFLCIPGFSLGTTANTIVGNLVGKREFDQIIPAIKKLLIVSVTIVFSYLLLSFVFLYEWISFYTSDSNLIEMCIEPMKIMFVGMLLFPFGNTLFQGVVSLGNTKRALYLEFFTIVLYTGYMYLVIKVFNLNLTWAWSSELFYWTFLFLCSYLYLKFSPWKKELELKEL